MDYAIKAAWDRGIRITMVFANNWDAYGGFQWYVNQHGGGDKNTFYTNPEIKAHFKKYIKNIVTRVNREYNPTVAYADDPAIFAWELANEPCGVDTTDAAGNKIPFDKTGKIINGWMREMSDFIRSLDSKHMITSGEEGYNNKRNSLTQGLMWTDDGTKSLDFDANIALSNINYATVHIYPDNWGNYLDLSYYSVTNIEDWIDWYLIDRAKVAQKAKKPIILEEYGRKKVGFLGTMTRDEIYQRWNALCATNGFAGMMVWQMEHPQMAAKDGDGYGFPFSDTTGDIMAANALAMNQKSGFIPVYSSVNP